MKLFKRKQATVSSDAAAEKIAGNITRRQRQLADYLNHKISGVPKKFLASALFGFCVAFGAYCIYLLYNSILN
ncbi:hypothetical protein EZ428_09275 [Pedobacter frigiditerrae]|uniref:DUF3989 domain-containing protein n=1 Tax=Pedobacter frigiditerrae TaxID=2530452 RepID=A0A4R0MXB8_9SPHI|nr:hypothetical protein [Pedobacter frigiditerrae]TCC91929.1 hypothetical protein EZ428_09275 [Pedobacter frigiditerrae]